MAVCFALVRLRAPAEAAVPEHYSQDFYFLIDRSGSMEGFNERIAFPLAFDVRV